MVPKVESVNDIIFILDKIKYHRASGGNFHLITLILSIESANSLLQMSSIIKQFRAEVHRQGAGALVQIGALLFARWVKMHKRLALLCCCIHLTLYRFLQRGLLRLYGHHPESNTKGTALSARPYGHNCQGVRAASD